MAASETAAGSAPPWRPESDPRIAAALDRSTASSLRWRSVRERRARKRRKWAWIVRAARSLAAEGGGPVRAGRRRGRDGVSEGGDSGSDSSSSSTSCSSSWKRAARRGREFRWGGRRAGGGAGKQRGRADSIAATRRRSEWSRRWLWSPDGLGCSCCGGGGGGWV